MGIRVFGLGFDPRTPGRYSRYLSFRLVPDSVKDPAGLLDVLKRISKDTGAPMVLFPTRDADLFFLDQYRQELEADYRFVLPAHDVLWKIMDKFALATEAALLGVAVPMTIVASSGDDLQRLTSRFAFPIVVKPRMSVDWRNPEIRRATGGKKAFLAASREELAFFYDRIHGFHPEVILQEWIEGLESDHYIFCCYMDKRHAVLGSAVFRKWLQYPPNFGLGCLVESVRDPEVEEMGTSLLQGIRYSGMAEVEFKRDGKTNELKLIEINPRPWDQLPLATRCGVNLCHAAFLDAMGQSVPVQASRTGIFWIDSEGMLRRLASDLIRGEKVDSQLIMRLFAAGKKYSLFSLRDPIPGLQWCKKLCIDAARDALRYAADKTGGKRRETRET